MSNFYNPVHYISKFSSQYFIELIDITFDSY